MATPHFTDDELRCRDGCGLLPPRAFQERLEGLRLAYGKPIHVSSGARCREYDLSVGGSGAHALGAIDTPVSYEDAWNLLYYAFMLRWPGIGIRQHGDPSKRMVHLDWRAHVLSQDSPRVWTYNEEK